MIRILVVEDSPTARGLLVEILESDPEIQVIGQAENGAQAVELAIELRPDLITMDVHMPVLDGFEATKEIMIRAPVPIVIVSSSESGREVELSLNAIRAGALMVIPKPDTPRSDRFHRRREELLAMAKAMARVKVVRRWATPGPAVQPPPRRLPSGTPVRLVAIAASTGGPAALQHILSALPGDFLAPILVVQHIAQGFVGGLADWLSGSCGLRVKVAENDEPLHQRTVFLAPDDRHLGVSRYARIVVTDSPAIDGFRPSGSYLFESAAAVFGTALAAVILTGMGADGVSGLKAVRAARGRVLAQDEASCVVYGMPREAVAAGVVDAVLPLEEVAPRLTQWVAGENHHLSA